MKQVKAAFQFFLAFFIAVFVLITVLWATLFHENAILSALDQSDYYESSVVAFNQRLQEDARPSGFPLELFDDFVSVEQGEALMSEHALFTLRGLPYEYPLEAYKEQLHSLLYGYMEENQIKSTLAIQQGVQLFIDDTAQTYRRILRVPFLDTYASLIQLYQKLLPYMVAGSMGAILFVVWMLYKLNTRNKRFIQDVLISTMSAGWMIVILPLLLLLNSTFGKITIEPQYFGAFLSTLVNTFLCLLILIGSSLLMIGLLLGIYNGNRIETRKKRSMTSSV